ncbi:MAG TPA: hypothetical protein VKT77_23625 [Chthonomonadaceae bacterium]|nr:hypothetical protein [Chthonomonadaceae bacterium]
MYCIRSGEISRIADGRSVEFTSPFAQEYYDQENANFQRGAWKRGDGRDTGIVTRSMLWGANGQARKPQPPRASFITQRGSRLYYVLEMANSAGLFYFDCATGQETRLFHGSDFTPSGVCVGDDYSLISTASEPDGSVHLTLLNENGRLVQTLTSGDCVDERPFRVADFVYYQSSGLARGPNGEIARRSPTAICRLELSSGEVEEVVASPVHDYLLPMAAADGSLYCIRAEYVPFGRYPIQNILLDAVLFPWRICIALFGFLNAFSVLFGKRSLTTAGGPDTPPVDMTRHMIHNRMIDLSNVRPGDKKRLAATRDWKLMRICDGKQSVVASHALWYTLDESGAPIYTDGFSVFDTDGRAIYSSDGLITCLARDGGDTE